MVVISKMSDVSKFMCLFVLPFMFSFVFFHVPMEQMIQYFEHFNN